jgi:capsular exopolysaccharide synthesis family protein
MNKLVPSQQHSDSGADRWTYSTPVRSNSPDQEGAPIDLTRLLSILRRRWWLIAMVTLAAGAVASYQVRRQPRVYHASAIVQLLESRNALASGLVRDNGGVPAMYMTPSEAEIIRSRAVAEVVVDSEPLGIRVKASGFPNSFLSDVSLDENVSTLRVPLTFTRSGIIIGSGDGELTPYGQPATHAGVRFIILSQPPEVMRGALIVTSRDQAADRVLSSVNAIPRKQTNLIDIVYAADDPLTAKRVVNRVAQAYQAVDTRMAQQQLRRRRLFIEDQLARTDAQLAEADRALSTFRNQQHAYSSQEKFKFQQAALVGLDVRREELDGDRKMARSLLRRFETGDDAARKSALGMLSSAPEISGDRSPVPALYQLLVGYYRSRAELISGPLGKATTHPEVQRIDTLIASTQSDILSAARAHVALLDARIEALDEVRTRNASSLEQRPAAEAAETRLQQNAEVLRGQGATLRMEHQRARIAEAAELGQVKIVDLATRASMGRSTGPRFIAFALLLGLLAGGGIALLLEGADRTVKRRDDLELSLHVPVLGTIPRIEANGNHKSRLPVLSGITSRRTTSTSKRRKVALTAVVQSRSPGAEAFRHLGTSLFYSRAGLSARRILVTSPAEGDGKTSVASNLAITLAQQRHRVLLVDCDVYGKLHTIFQLPVSPGVSEIVLDGLHPTAVIQATGVAGLFLMTSGRLSEHPSDVIGSERMRALLNDMTHEFDIVVLDCSPILALADSTILSVNSDAVLLVVRAGYTATAAAVEAMRQLSTVGARVAGVVLNDPEDRARQYGSYYAAYSYAGR